MLLELVCGGKWRPSSVLHSGSSVVERATAVGGASPAMEWWPAYSREGVLQLVGRCLEQQPQARPTMGGVEAELSRLWVETAGDGRADGQRAEAGNLTEAEEAQFNSGVCVVQAMVQKNIHQDGPKAEERYRAAIEADPTNASALDNLGLLLQTVRKQPDEAEKCYRAAIEADSTHAPALHNLGSLLQFVRKQPDEAEKCLRAAIEADPTNAPALNNLGHLLHTVRKQLDEAEKYYRAAIEADPTYASALHNLGTLWHEQGDAASAVEALERAAAADPDDSVTTGWLQTARAALESQQGKPAGGAKERMQRKVREKKRAERVSWWAAVDAKGAAAQEQQLCDKMEAVSVQGGGAEEGKRTRSRGGRKKKKR